MYMNSVGRKERAEGKGEKTKEETKERKRLYCCILQYLMGESSKSNAEWDQILYKNYWLYQENTF